MYADPSAAPESSFQGNYRLVVAAASILGGCLGVALIVICGLTICVANAYKRKGKAGGHQEEELVPPTAGEYIYSMC